MPTGDFYVTSTNTYGSNMWIGGGQNQYPYQTTVSIPSVWERSSAYSKVVDIILNRVEALSIKKVSLWTYIEGELVEPDEEAIGNPNNKLVLGGHIMIDDDNDTRVIETFVIDDELYQSYEPAIKLEIDNGMEGKIVQYMKDIMMHRIGVKL